MVSRRRRIVVVEREDSIAELLEMVLDQVGYEVSARISQLEDPAAIAQYHPDLLLLDLASVAGAPSAGLDLLSSHEATDKIPIICMSTLAIPEEVLSRRNVAGGLTKPFDIEDLVSAVRRAA